MDKEQIINSYPGQLDVIDRAELEELLDAIIAYSGSVESIEKLKFDDYIFTYGQWFRDPRED